VSTEVKGTLSYLAPEYAMLGKANEGCDVYSFGILFLELASGRRPVEKLSSTVKQAMVDLALPLVCEKKFSELAYPRLNGNYVEEELKRVVFVALICAQVLPGKRPTMLDVVELLKGESKDKFSHIEINENEMFRSPLKTFRKIYLYIIRQREPNKKKGTCLHLSTLAENKKKCFNF